MQSSYFGHDEFAKYAPGLEESERCRGDPDQDLARLRAGRDDRGRTRTLAAHDFCAGWRGPTGVELAASMAHMATVTLRRNFRRIDPAKSSIVLLEGGNRILPTFAESLSSKATKQLEKLGVKVLTGKKSSESMSKALSPET